MGDLYRLAQTTISWLGSGIEEPDSYNADWAMRTIQNCSPQTVQRVSWETVEPAIMLAYEALKPYDENWKAWPLQVSWLLGRCSYWSRMWIVQEVLLSSKLVVKFGVHEITWEQLEHFLNLSRAYSSNLEQLNVILPERYKISFERGRAAAGNIESLMDVRRRWQQRAQTVDTNGDGGHFTWPEILPLCKGRGCMDQRDRVFGILALVKPSLAIPVDYGKPATEMWKQVIEIAMRRDHNLQAYLNIEYPCCAYGMYWRLGFDLYDNMDLLHSEVQIDDITCFVVEKLHQRGGRPTCQHFNHVSRFDEVLQKLQEKNPFIKQHVLVS